MSETLLKALPTPPSVQNRSICRRICFCFFTLAENHISTAQHSQLRHILSGKKQKSRKDTSLHHLLDVTVSVFSANLLCPCFRRSGQFARLKSSEKPLRSCPLLILLLLDLMLVGFFFFFFFPVYSIWNCNLVCIRNRAHVNKTLPRLHTHLVF